MLIHNERIQIERKVEKTGNSSKTDYIQLTNHPKDVRKYDYAYR